MSTNVLLESRFSDDEHKRYLIRVCFLLLSALTLTGVVAWYFSTIEPVLRTLFFTKILWIESYWYLIALEVFVAISLSTNALKVPVWQAYSVFYIYSTLIGILISPVFLIYTSQSILMVFFYSAVLFLVAGFLGVFLDFDFSRLSHTLFAGLITLVIVSAANILLFRLDVLEWILSLAGVIIFTVLIAYDAAKLRQINEQGNEYSEQEHREVVLGTLIMYIDFMNVFLRLLRLLGKKK